MDTDPDLVHMEIQDLGGGKPGGGAGLGSLRVPPPARSQAQCARVRWWLVIGSGPGTADLARWHNFKCACFPAGDNLKSGSSAPLQKSIKRVICSGPRARRVSRPASPTPGVCRVLRGPRWLPLNGAGGSVPCWALRGEQKSSAPCLLGDSRHSQPWYKPRHPPEWCRDGEEGEGAPSPL